MSTKSLRLSLVLPVLMMVALPLFASWFAYPLTHLPPEFGVFPPIFVEKPPGFILIIFVNIITI